MRNLLLLLAPLAFSLAVGCTKEDVEGLAGEKNILERAAEKVVHTVPRTGVKAELALIRGQLKNYRAMHEGKSPEAIDTLSWWGRLKYQDQYLYDPSTGEIKSTTYPEL